MSLLTQNLLSPIALAFALGVAARLVRSELSLPKDIYAGLGVYLLFALGIKGGVELAHSTMASIIAPVGVTLLLGCLTPVTTYLAARRLARLGAADAAALAAHHGSVSAVTFIAAQTFVTQMGAPPEGFMPTLLTLLESPGIHIGLAIGALQAAGGHRSTREVLHEVLTGRTMILLVGGLLIGVTMGDANWQSVEGFFDTRGPVFRGVLCLFLLEMGIVAGSRIADLTTVGARLLAFGILVPLAHGLLGVGLGHLSGLSAGGAAVLGAMAASASYIAAPPAVRVTLPSANPTYYLTCALAITFPFNILAGIPLYYEAARWLAGRA